MKPRIFLGSSGQQAKLLDSLTRGLEQVADVEPWTTVFNPGTSTLARLVEPPGRSTSPRLSSRRTTGRRTATCRPGLAAGQRRVRGRSVRWRARHATYVHPPCQRRQLPTDLLGLTCVRYDGTSPSEIKTINQKSATRSRPRAGSPASRGSGGSTR